MKRSEYDLVFVDYWAWHDNFTYYADDDEEELNDEELERRTEEARIEELLGVCAAAAAAYPNAAIILCGEDEIGSVLAGASGYDEYDRETKKLKPAGSFHNPVWRCAPDSLYE